MPESYDVERLNDLQSHFYYLSRYVQMEALTSAYRSYKLRNAILEERTRHRLKAENRPMRVCYYVHTLDQLSYPLLEELQRDEGFDLRMLAREPQQIDFLREKGFAAYVIHSLGDKFRDYRPVDKTTFQADICFSEMPYGIFPSLEESIRPWMISGGWLPKYRDIFSLHELNNALFCLVQYAYTLANEWLWLKSKPDLNVHYCLPYPNFSWMYFLESDAHLDYACSRNHHGNTSNYVVTGYPKYDVYLQTPQKPLKFRWKYPEGTRKRIVYAPHFFRSDAFLENTCKTLLALADTGQYEVVFKPHPNPNKIVDEYTPKFNAHPNAQVERGADSSQYIFATADLAIISSVSMHADAVFANLPFISELDPENFNHIGLEIQSVGYKPDEQGNFQALIEDVLTNDKDPHREARVALRARLLPPGGRMASDNILTAIRERLGRA